MLGIVLFTLACSTDRTDDAFTNSHTIRLAADPDRLNPILSSQAEATQIERWIFNPLQEYNPETLELEPVLIEHKPIVTPTSDGGTRFNMRIRDEARWDSGAPITGLDYLFSMKACLIPDIENASWSTFVSQISSITVPPNDPQSIEVLVDESYMQSEEIVTGFQVYPEHIYDPSGILRCVTFADLRSPDDLSEEVLDSLTSFAEAFNSEVFSREIVEGSGPYEFVEWQSQQAIRLRKKTDWWGQDHPHPVMQAIPKDLTYYIIPDEQTALTSLKDDGLDLVADISPDQFAELANLPEGNEIIKLYTPSVLQYYYIAYNTSHPALSDASTRLAISHLMDLETLIDALFYGQASATVGPIHPSKRPYASHLTPITLNVDKAKSLLDEAGWKDLNGDGTLERTIAGERIPLDLRIFTTRSQLSQDVAVLLKQEAQKVGLAIDVVPMEFRTMLQDVRAGRFEMACLARRPPVGDYDPFPYWHSANIGPQGNNLCKFSNRELDAVIDQIRSAPAGSDRMKDYHKFQEIIYREQPALFLVAPAMRIALDARFEVMTSPMRPGYFENTITAF